jgi:hypothetical protein
VERGIITSSLFIKSLFKQIANYFYPTTNYFDAIVKSVTDQKQIQLKSICSKKKVHFNTNMLHSLTKQTVTVTIRFATTIDC